jgi:hypothetical protein
MHAFLSSDLAANAAIQFANEMGHPPIEITGFRLIIDVRITYENLISRAARHGKTNRLALDFVKAASGSTSQIVSLPIAIDCFFKKLMGVMNK